MLIKVKSENSGSGNPQRGWIHVDSDGNFIGFVDEGFLGNGAIKPLLEKGEKETESIEIPVKEYKKWKSRSEKSGSNHWFYK